MKYAVNPNKLAELKSLLVI